MRAHDPEVFDAVWSAVESLIPVPVDEHPLGRHRPRKPDHDCFNVMLVRLATGCSWEDAERLCGGKVSDTTARQRRDEWLAAGVFDAIAQEALAAYDRVMSLDLSDVAVDGSLHKSPCGGEGTGKNPTDRGKLGWKWSVLTDRNGIPVGWTVEGVNRNDSVLLAPTLDDAAERGLLGDIETIWLDRGYDSEAHAGVSPSASLTTRSSRRNANEDPTSRRKTNRWECAGRSSAPIHGSRTSGSCVETPTARSRIGSLSFLAVAFLLTAKLIDWRNRWSPTMLPIR